MEKTFFFNDFCANKECEEYIAWSFDNGGCEYLVNCESCKLIGQSYDITEYPKNCLFLNDIQAYEREQQQALNIPVVTVPKGTFCNLYKKECMGKFCSVTPEPDKCYHLRLQNAR